MKVWGAWRRCDECPALSEGEGERERERTIDRFYMTTVATAKRVSRTRDRRTAVCRNICPHMSPCCEGYGAVEMLACGTLKSTDEHISSAEETKGRLLLQERRSILQYAARRQRKKPSMAAIDAISHA